MPDQIPHGTFAGISRLLIAAALGWLVNSGLLPQDSVGPATDALLIVAVGVWTVVSKYRARARAVSLAHEAAMTTHVSGLEAARDLIQEAKQENRV